MGSPQNGLDVQITGGATKGGLEGGGNCFFAMRASLLLDLNRAKQCDGPGFPL